MLAIRIAVLVLVAATGCAKKVQDHRSERDFSNPKWTVSSIFYAAQTGDTRHLASLCDPQGEVNEYARRVCDLHVGSPAWKSFVENFEKGTLIGEARISGNHAMVNFAFGPDGARPETMELVRRGDRWYISAF
jgi:hypothetical protein